MLTKQLCHPCTALICGLFYCTATHARPAYQIADVGVGGVSGVVINDSGQYALSTSLEVDGASNSLYLSLSDELRSLPTLGGRVSSISDINNSGTVVGVSRTAEQVPHATVYLSGAIIDLGEIRGFPSAAAAINDYGVIVGEMRGDDSTIGFIMNGPEHVMTLGSLGGRVTMPTDINNQGQVVGISLSGKPWTTGPTDAPAQEGFLWQNGVMVGIGSLGGNTSNAFSINDLGQIVGETALSDGEFHAFIYDPNGGMRDLGTSGMQSAAHSINNAGVVVGYAVDELGKWRAALFDESSEVQFLDQLIPSDSGWERLIRATDVNTQGQIAGVGLFAGEIRGFILTPIPEPAAILAAALALMGLFSAARRRLQRS
jgi:probable HAF family extracellular repeat protein